MRFRILLLAMLVTATHHATAQTAVASTTSVWPTHLRSGIYLLLTTKADPQPVPCRLRSLAPDAITCTSSYRSTAITYPRDTIAFITDDPHERHVFGLGFLKVSLYVAAPSLLGVFFGCWTVCGTIFAADLGVSLVVTGVVVIFDGVAHTLNAVAIIRGHGQLRLIYAAQ